MGKLSPKFHADCGSSDSPSTSADPLSTSAAPETTSGVYAAGAFYIANLARNTTEGDEVAHPW